MVYYSSGHRNSIKGTGQSIAIYEKQNLETLQTQKILLPFLYAEVPAVRRDVRTGVDDLLWCDFADIAVDFFQNHTGLGVRF